MAGFWHEQPTKLKPTEQEELEIIATKRAATSRENKNL
jgi:hypothetical protein